jgi:pimeloyl-ACP methyl ester carboxylesterase
MTKALRIPPRSFVCILAIAAALVPLGSSFGLATGQLTKTVVLVHGAFADGSSWNKIIPLLQAKGLKVVAVQNPLTSLVDDVAFARRAINAQPGPVVLVGHSWGGSVITAAGDDEKVKALVYVAAFAPSVGETSVDGIKDFPTSIGIQNPRLDPEGFLTLSDEAIVAYFAQNVPAAEANLIAATQGAIQQKSFEEKLTVAAWQTKPSWYIVAEQDLMIQPDAQRALAKKINAKVTSLPSDHVPMLSRPDDVANVILEAADSIK